MHDSIYTVKMNEEMICLRSRNGRRFLEAKIVAIERNSAGAISTVYCDRRIHSESMDIIDWNASGPVVTVLTPK